MTLRDALDQNKGIGPGFHFLRHFLSLVIVLFHCRQVVYWQNSAHLLAIAGVTDVGAFVQASQHGPIHFTAIEMFRPAFHAMLGMFFGLSGFLIAGSALRATSIGGFFFNRALRIFPALMVETLLSGFILGPLVTALSLRDYFTNPEFFRYFGNILGFVYFYLPGVFLNNPLPRTVNGQLWTLPLELYCYLAMLILLWANLIRQPTSVFMIGVIGVILMLLAYHYDPVDFSPKNQNFFSPWYIVAIFWFGVIFYINADYIPLSKHLIVGCIILYWATMFFKIFTPLSGVFLTYVTLYIGFMKFPLWNKIIKSDYSYGLFLYHFPIMQAYMYFLIPHWQHVPLIGQFVMLTILCVPTTIGFAAISWRLIEKPALSLRSTFARTKPVIPDDPIVIKPVANQTFVIVPVK